MPKITSLFEKHKIISGAFILTLANFLTRIIGFFYRIYVAQIFSDESIGILQLTGPVTMLFFSICAIGMQSAISRFTAAATNRTTLFFFSGICSAFFLSTICSIFLYTNSGFIACHFLFEPRCEPLLHIHAISLPLSTLHACMNGYFFGKQKSVYPALSQVIEQVTRIVFLYLFVFFANTHNLHLTLSITVLGELIGELMSVIYSILILTLQNNVSSKVYFTFFSTEQRTKLRYYIEQTIFANKLLFSHAVPISCNRILISCFNSLEATLIPNRLIFYGLSQAKALSAYGTLTGMAFPVIYFPASILTAVCMMLFPTIAKAQAQNMRKKIKTVTCLSCLFSLSVSILSSLFFCLLGEQLGNLLFHNPNAGSMIKALGLLCPLLYLPGVLITILNALGHTTKTLIFQVTATLLRLYFVFFVIPNHGISAYFTGIFASQLLLTVLNFLALHKYIVYNDSGLSEI